MTAPEGFYDGLGASLCAPIMGVDPHRSPYDVWNEYLHPEARPNLDDNEQVEAGIALEPAIAQWAAKKWGIQIQYQPPLAKHPTLPFIQCHPDALVVGETAGMEVKNRGFQTLKLYRSLDAFESDSDRAQASEVLQCHASMLVTGASHWYLAVAVAGQKLLRFRIERDQEIADAIEGRYTEFWDYIQRGTPPPPINAADCHALWQHHVVGKVIEADEELAALAERRRTLKDAVKEAEGELEFVEFRLKRAMQDAEELRYKGVKLLTWREQKRAGYVVKATAFRVMR
jgi:putative phage-type endonuclease